MKRSEHSVNLVSLPKQLEDALSMLVQHGLHPWIDTGTALGLVREGGVLWDPGKDDLDISLWYEDVHDLASAAADFVKAGYRQEIWRWKGDIFKWKFIPKDPISEYPIDIKLYQRARDYCWTPLIYGRSPPTRVLSALCIRLRDRLLANKNELNLGEWPLNTVIGIYTFWIPTRFFDELVPWKGTQALLPKDINGFLSLHYGKWREPNHRWNSVAHDGSVIHKIPKHII